MTRTATAIALAVLLFTSTAHAQEMSAWDWFWHDLHMWFVDGEWPVESAYPDKEGGP